MCFFAQIFLWGLEKIPNIVINERGESIWYQKQVDDDEETIVFYLFLLAQS